MLKRLFISTLIIISYLNLNAQSAALKQGDIYFEKGSYYNATLNYEIYLGLREAPVSFAPYSNNKKKKLLDISEVDTKKPNAVRVFYNLAQSYRLLNDYEKAEKWYNKLLLSRNTKFPLTRLWHGVSLRALGKYDAAEKDLNKFLQENKDVNLDMVPVANNELNNIAFIRKQLKSRKPASFTLNKLRGDVNQIEGAFAPVIMNDTLVFTSSRIVDTVNKFSKTNSHVNHLFVAGISTETDSVFGKSKIIKFPSRTAANEGTPSFNSEGNVMYFSRWDTKDGKTTSAIYYSKKGTDSTWTEPEKLDEKINKVGYNSNQPFLTQDGNYLLFASDRPDGLGKYDLWASPLDSGKLGDAFNLTIANTKDDDKAPFYHSANKTLVFSTNGRVGMGGFDLFSAQGDLNDLKTPVNMGPQINSFKDDNYFFSTSKDSMLKKAYVSSDRKSACCLEIFAVKVLPKKSFTQKVDGLISDKKTNKGIPNAKVIINLKDSSTKELTANSEGLFLVTIDDSITGFTFKKKGYNELTQPFNYDSELYADTIYALEFQLDKGKKVFYKQTLNAVVIDCDTKKPITKAYVTVVNGKDTTKNFVVSTNALGKFSADLKEGTSAIWFERKDYFDKEINLPNMSDSLENDTVYTKTYCLEKWHPEDPNQIVPEITDINKVNDKINVINRRDSTVIHFDFNKTDIKPEAAAILDNLLLDLKTYPTIELSLDISGHTDSKGTDEVNLRIGRQRAISCLDYLISKGISQSRLSLKSKGKKEHVAPETINNKDNPAGRAKNRRVVMKVKAKFIVADKK